MVAVTCQVVDGSKDKRCITIVRFCISWYILTGQQLLPSGHTQKRNYFITFWWLIKLIMNFTNLQLLPPIAHLLSFLSFFPPSSNFLSLMRDP